MNLNVSEDQIDALLKQNDDLTPPDKPEPSPIQEESLEKLLEEIMSSAPAPPPASALSEERVLFPFKEKPKRVRVAMGPIWLTIAVLGTFLIGTVFGFYWGKKDPSIPTLKSLDQKLFHLTEQVKVIFEAMEPPSSPQEIIQPLEDASHTTSFR